MSEKYQLFCNIKFLKYKNNNNIYIYIMSVREIKDMSVREIKAEIIKNGYKEELVGLTEKTRVRCIITEIERPTKKKSQYNYTF